MMFRKLLLVTLLTLSSGLALVAQSVVNVHGTVTAENGDPESNVNLVVSAFFADSTFFFQSVETDGNGFFNVEIQPPMPNLFGVVDVTLIDCWGITQSQQFFILNGDETFEANFIYCEGFMIDSCTVILLEEISPNGGIQLNAWTPPGSQPSFVWSTGDSSQVIFPTQPGTYCVTATFAAGCVETDCIKVDLDTTANCYGYILSSYNGDGTYNLQAFSFGVAPFSYYWQDGQTTEVIYNVPPGTYCVDIHDAAGCWYSTCVVIEDASFCEAFIYEDPAGSLTVSGFGQAPFQYLWNTGETTETIFPTQAGLYCATLTDDVGCETSTCYYWYGQNYCYAYIYPHVLDSPTVLALDALIWPLDSTITYQWSTGETTPTIYPADPNLGYCVTVTTGSGCSSVACFDVNQWCYAWVTPEYLDTNLAVLHVGTDSLFQIGGVFEVTYLWPDSSTGPTYTVTESGEYCVTVTIGDSCQTVTCTTVDFDQLNTNCSAYVYTYQDSAGQWYAEAWAWGFGDFGYVWSNGETGNVIPISGPYDALCVTAISSFGCEAEACIDTLFWPCEAWVSVNYIDNQSAVLTATIYNNPSGNATYLWNTGDTAPVITVTADGVYCVTVESGGCVTTSCVEVFFWNVDSCGVWISANPHPAGVEYIANVWGVAPFTYQWSNGSTEPSQLIDFGIHDLCVTVTDAVGCISTACNFLGDSCSVWLNYGQGVITAFVSDPLAAINWSTGDTASTVIQITEPGTYCVSVTTIFGCVAEACIAIDTLDPGGNPFIISGYVTGDSVLNLDGRVDAIRINLNSGEPFIIAGSSPIGAGGFYSIDGLSEGLYLIRAELTPGTVGAEDFMPTYYYASSTWENADPHVLPNWLPVTTDIRLIRSSDLNGGGVIGGVVSDPNQIIAGEGDSDRGVEGIGGITVLLFDQQGQPLQYVTTLEDGTFKFDGLPWGTYRISYDVAGLTSPDIWVTLTPQEPERLQITLIINQGTVKTDDPVSQLVNLFPNPTSVEINIQVPGINETYDVQVADLQGKIVYAGSARNLNGILTVGVGTFAPGWYVVQLKGENGHYHGKFIKQD